MPAIRYLFDPLYHKKIQPFDAYDLLTLDKESDNVEVTIAATHGVVATFIYGVKKYTTVLSIGDALNYGVTNCIAI